MAAAALHKVITVRLLFFHMSRKMSELELELEIVKFKNFDEMGKKLDRGNITKTLIQFPSALICVNVLYCLQSNFESKLWNAFNFFINGLHSLTIMLLKEYLPVCNLTLLLNSFNECPLIFPRDIILKKQTPKATVFSRTAWNASAN